VLQHRPCVLRALRSASGRSRHRSLIADSPLRSLARWRAPQATPLTLVPPKAASSEQSPLTAARPAANSEKMLPHPGISPEQSPSKSARPSAIEAVPFENTQLRLTVACGSSPQGSSGIGRVLGPVVHPVRVATATATGARPLGICFLVLCDKGL
jgi:hypothetical protein